MSKVDNTQKEKINPIYQELIGYLSQAPDMSEIRGDFFIAEDLLTLINGSIEELNNITGRDYNKFKLSPYFPYEDSTESYLILIPFKQKLGGLISKLHGEYFSDDSNPLQEPPGMQIRQVIQQNQYIVLQTLLRNEIDSKISSFSEDSKEGKFLNKLRDSIGTVNNLGDLLSTIHKLAKTIGLSIDKIFSIFS